MSCPERSRSSAPFARALLLLALAAPTLASQEPTLDSALSSEIARRVSAHVYPAIVVGVLEGSKTRVFAYDAAAPDGRSVDGNSIFEIGSITKVFTGTLLADMVARGELAYDDSIAKFLPPSVKVPRRQRAITLLDLSEQHSGLPRLPDNMHPADADNPYADYSVEQLYAFLSSYQLPRDVGSQFEYSNLGVGLLGHVLSLRSGKSWEQLATERIMTPLGMTDTRVTLTPAMLSRLAMGHDPEGKVVKNWDVPTLVGAGGLRSSANDMLKLVRASIDPHAPVHAALAEAQRPRREVAANGQMSIGLNWFTQHRPDRDLVWHNGGTGGYRSFLGIDVKHGRGIVVLVNSQNGADDVGRHWLDPSLQLAHP